MYIVVRHLDSSLLIINNSAVASVCERQRLFLFLHWAVSPFRPKPISLTHSPFSPALNSSNVRLQSPQGPIFGCSNTTFIRGKHRETGFWLNPLTGFLLKAGQGDWALPKGGARRVRLSLRCWSCTCVPEKPRNQSLAGMRPLKNLARVASVWL